MEFVKKIISLNNTEKPSNRPLKPFSAKVAPYHLAFWTVYVSLAYWSINSDDIGRLENSHALLNLLFGLAIFYSLSEFWLPKLTFQPQKTRIALVALLSFFILITIKIAFTKYVSGVTYTLPNFIIHEMTRSFLFSLLALGFWFVKLAMGYQKKTDENERQIKKLSVERRINQLSPHFLFNSLNTLMAEIHIYSKKHANSIISLSDIVRYAFLSDNPLSTMQEEIAVLEKFLKLQRKRFKNDLYLNYSKSGEFENIAPLLPIPKMILTTIIENIFKHGCYTDPDFPVEIRIDINKTKYMENAYKFTLELKNKTKHLKSIESFGLGLKNSEEILDHYLQNRFTMSKAEIDGIFHLKFQINYELELLNGSHY